DPPPPAGPPPADQHPTRAFAIARRGRYARHFILPGEQSATARQDNSEPRINIPAGVDAMKEWSVCISMVVHDQEFGADGETPWTRGMSLLNRWHPTDRFR